jgi:hypothetical protein
MPTGEGAEWLRTFSGIAYSGESVSYWGSPLVIVLASLSLPDPCPVLLQRVGPTQEAQLWVCSVPRD